MKYHVGEFKVAWLRDSKAVDSASQCPLVESPEAVGNYWREHIQIADYFDGLKEHFYVLHVNARRRAIGHSLISVGYVDCCYVHPREVFKPAIVCSASAIILMHNHPSGESSPSESDIKITRDICAAGRLLKIDVLDHIIIGTGITSLRELGFFNG